MFGNHGNSIRAAGLAVGTITAAYLMNRKSDEDKEHKDYLPLRQRLMSWRGGRDDDDEEAGRDDDVGALAAVEKELISKGYKAQSVNNRASELEISGGGGSSHLPRCCPCYSSSETKKETQPTAQTAPKPTSGSGSPKQKPVADSNVSNFKASDAAPPEEASKGDKPPPVSSPDELKGWSLGDMLPTLKDEHYHHSHCHGLLEKPTAIDNRVPEEDVRGFLKALVFFEGGSHSQMEGHKAKLYLRGNTGFLSRLDPDRPENSLIEFIKEAGRADAIDVKIAFRISRRVKRSDRLFSEDDDEEGDAKDLDGLHYCDD